MKPPRIHTLQALFVAAVLAATLIHCASAPERPRVNLAPVTGAVAQAHTRAEQEATGLALRNARRDALLQASLHLHTTTQTSDDAQRAVPPPPPGPVLLLGDSMAWALGVELEPLMEADGHPFRFEYKVSDSVRAWRSSKAKPLKEGLRKHKATEIVIIVLGSNDYFFPRSETLKSTLELTNTLVGERGCYWVGPPMWREDKGIVAFLAENLAPCAFFNSSELTLERRTDGIHPNREGSKAWAEAVYAWIQSNPPAAQKNKPLVSYHP